MIVPIDLPKNDGQLVSDIVLEDRGPYSDDPDPRHLIIYLDTSAFVKLVSMKPAPTGAPLVRRGIAGDLEHHHLPRGVLGTRAARPRMGPPTARRWTNGSRSWTHAGPSTARVRVDERGQDESRIEHRLRGMDAVQLGAAVAVRALALRPRGPRSSRGVRPAAARGRRARGLRHARRPAVLDAWAAGRWRA